MNPSSGAEFFTQLRHPFLPFQTPPNEGIVLDKGRSQILILVQSPQLKNLNSFVPSIGHGYALQTRLSAAVRRSGRAFVRLCKSGVVAVTYIRIGRSV